MYSSYKLYIQGYKSKILILLSIFLKTKQGKEFVSVPFVPASKHTQEDFSVFLSFRFSFSSLSLGATKHSVNFNIRMEIGKKQTPELFLVVAQALPMAFLEL